ncbi:hypothetical protein JTB14_003464 [Gonioctena quinquepunctata]|nr:hypothetical protein JTB14_003464 [Gonioctena quinquepunctata]
MSDESISHKEDKENLLYIARKIHLEEFATIGDEHSYLRESLVAGAGGSLSHQLGSEEDLITQAGKQLGPKVFTDPDIISRTRPFDLQWSFGVNTKVAIKTTASSRNEILFASSHFPILYNYCTREMRHLEGHQYLIVDLSSDKSGRYLVTADESTDDGFLHIWDIEKCTEKRAPLYSLYSIYPHFGIDTVKMSESAKYIITIGGVSKEEYNVDFWLWTLGNDLPDGSFLVPRTFGHPVSILWNPTIEEHIMVIFTKQVFLLVWDNETNTLMHSATPQILHKSQIGLLTGGTYMDKCHECYASSNKGCILIFGNTLYAKPYEEGELDNTKIFRNAVKISPVSIGSCRTIDGTIVIGDARGYIYFFDRRMRILYWLCNFNLGSILAIDFSLFPKFKYQEADKYFMQKTQDDRIFNCDFEDMVEELEVLFQKDIPTDASLDRSPFIFRDFFVATADRNIYAIDCVNNKCTSLFHVADDHVAAIGAHDELNYLVIAYANGRITLMDFEKREVISTTMLPIAEDEEGVRVPISCIKYSIGSFHLICGRANGEIWILDPVLLTPTVSEPFRITKHKVVKIDFCQKPMQFAYFDDNKTVVIFSYNPKISGWECMGKIRSHENDITDIMFVADTSYAKLYTISKDRHLVEYNSSKIGSEEFDLETRERIEQSAMPLCFIHWVRSDQYKQLGYLLISDDKHKLKILYQSSKVPKVIVQAPAFGCFKNQLIRKMVIIPHCESRYMAFATNKHFGLHILPPDGNPYKYVGYLAHPIGLEDIVLSYNGKYIFTFGTNDHCVFQWTINLKSVEVMKVLGGKELEPFYCLIEGGYSGWLFQEIKDLFYYMQILQQENIDLPRRVSDTISISEIPDLFRTIGFYPSEFELENILIEVRYRNMDERQKINEDINFIDFVKLYCNHKPVYGYSRKSIEEAFEVLIDNNEEEPTGVDTVDRDEFIESLTTLGEPLTNTNALKCFQTLMREEEPSDDFSFLPEEIDFQMFFENILGIDMDRKQEPEKSESDTELSAAGSSFELSD